MLAAGTIGPGNNGQRRGRCPPPAAALLPPAPSSLAPAPPPRPFVLPLPRAPAAETHKSSSSMSQRTPCMPSRALEVEHRLSSNTMALTISDCDAMWLPAHQMALITSVEGCTPDLAIEPDLFLPVIPLPDDLVSLDVPRQALAACGPAAWRVHQTRRPL